MQDIHFFTVCNQPYFDFILPFFYSTLKMNEGATAEVVVDDESAWRKGAAKQIEFLDKYYEGRWRVRNNREEYHRPNQNHKHSSATFRFLEIPSVKREYTYIADIDILFTSPNVYDYEKSAFATHEFNFNNFLRKNQKRFTGCYCVKSKDYYNSMMPVIEQYFKDPRPFRRHGWGDEHVLYSLLEKAMPCPKSTILLRDGIHMRKIHGIHVSPNRAIDGVPGWGFDKARRSEYRHMKRQDEWDEFIAAVTPTYKVKVIDVLEKHLP